MAELNINQTDLRPALLELVNSGVKQADIAREIGLSRATVNFAVRKKEGGWMPGYEAGRRLMRMLQRHRRTSKGASA